MISVVVVVIIICSIQFKNPVLPLIFVISAAVFLFSHAVTKYPFPLLLSTSTKIPEGPLRMTFQVGASIGGPPKPLVLVLGSEAHGLSTSILSTCNLVVRIPGLVDSHPVRELASSINSPLPTSLNVAAATAILLHQIKQLRSQTGSLLKFCSPDYTVSSLFIK